MKSQSQQQKTASSELNIIEKLQKSLSILAKSTNQSSYNFVLNFFKCLHTYLHGNFSQANLQESLNFDSYWQYNRNIYNSPVCSKIIGLYTDKVTFKCDCMESDNALLCRECFEAGDHKSHLYYEFRIPQGSCDCGNSELLNQKGFCNKHKLKEEIKIDQTKAKQFQDKLKFPFYIYLWGNYQGQSIGLRSFLQLYSGLFLRKVGQYIEENQQVKLMLSLLLSKPMDQFPPINSKKMSIVEQMFKYPQELIESVLMRNILFQLFTVQNFRTIILQQYFSKTFRNQEFPQTHSFSKLSYIYIGCVKLIVKLIQQNTLKPISLNPELPLKNIHQFMSAFRSFFSNFYYISEIKTAKQYYKLHLQKTNIVNMTFYSRYSNIDQRQEKLGVDFCLMDEILLKHIGLIFGLLIDEQKIIEKCLKELFVQITQRKEVGCSLASQRAFAMITVAYCKGNIQILKNQQKMKIFLNIIGANVPNKKKLFHKIIKFGLRSRIISIRFSQKIKVYQIDSDVQPAFNINHDEINIPFFLDTLFHKIFSYISTSENSYRQVLLQLFQQNCQNETESILKIIVFLNSVSSIDFDELVIANYLKIIDKVRIFDFLKKLLESFPHLNSKEFKSLALNIIKNGDIFQQFVKFNVNINKNKIINKDKHANKYVFVLHQQNFIDYNFTLKKQQNSKIIQYIHQNVVNIYDNVTISLIVLYYKKQMQKISTKKQLFCFDSLIIELLKIYLMTKNKQIQYFLCEIINNEAIKASLQIKTGNLVAEYINPHEQFIVKSEKQLGMKQKLQLKKKQAEIKIKKMQQATLNQYSWNIQDQKISQFEHICVYCKELKSNQSLKCLGYCNFTNLIQKKCFKNNDYHLFFNTCNHKIHASCYETYFKNKAEFFCILCKRQVNFIVPQSVSNKHLPSQNIYSQKQSKLSFIYPALVHSNFNRQNLVSSFFNRFKCNCSAIFIMSLVQEIVFTGLQNFEYFKKQVFPIVYELYEILKKQQINQLKTTFQILDIQFFKNKEESHVLLKPILFTYTQIKKYFFGVQTCEQVNLQNQIRQPLLKILSFLQQKDSIYKSQDLSSLNLISKQQILLQLPLKLIELAKHRGLCPICNKITNFIMVCLLCGWKVCRNCFWTGIVDRDHLQKYQHLDGTAMINCYSGNIYYAYGNYVKDSISLYQNYLGESMYEVDNQQQMRGLNNFALNKSKHEKLIKSILQHNLNNLATSK